MQNSETGKPVAKFFRLRQKSGSKPLLAEPVQAKIREKADDGHR
jgi:hypothetical protein